MTCAVLSIGTELTRGELVNSNSAWLSAALTDGARRVIATEQLGFIVERVGSAAEIEKLARGQPMLYGLLCIVLAGLAGWLGSVIFRRN